MGIVVLSLLLVHYALALGGVRAKSTTYDETAHITAGYTFWRFNDYRLQPENGNLPQRLAALPLVVSGSFVFPSRDRDEWRRSDVWTMGFRFFNGAGNDLAALLFRSRAFMALLGVALCLTVFLWARDLYGATGGLIALVLCAFSPIVLAHGPLATSDVCATLFFLLSTRALWLLLCRVTLLRTLAGAAALSGLALSKTSAILMLPMAAILVPAALLREGDVTARAPRRLLAVAGALVLCVAVAWGAIWISFGGRFAAAPPGQASTFQKYFFRGQPASTFADVAGWAGMPGKIVAVLARHRLFPEAFLYGTAFVFANAHHYGFLNGEIFVNGSKLFFPYCFLVKSTLPMLLVLATALVVAASACLGLPRTNRPEAPRAARRARDLIPESAPLWVLLLVYGPALIFSSIDIGARHMLPVYAAGFVLLGGLARWSAEGWRRWWIVFLLLWHVGEGLRGFPHYLAYFNQITGRRHAYRHLVDSNLDWGQDLPGLKAWLDRRRLREPGVPAYLSYFGTGSPLSYGIPAEPIDLQQRWGLGLPPRGRAGTYCVSATSVQTVYHPIRGRWNTRYEEAYQALTKDGGDPERLDLPKLQWLLDETGRADWQRRLRDLGSARLMAFLRGREPDAEIGYSILCYDLSADDLLRAFEGPAPEIAGAPREGERR